MRRVWPCLFALAACHRHHRDERPLREAIVGPWDVLCRTSHAHVSTCPDQEEPTLRKTFRADGTFELSTTGIAVGGDVGTWTLQGDTLEVHLDSGAGGQEVDLYRASLDDDRLLLWDAYRGGGTVLVRPGTAVEVSPLAARGGGEVSGKVGGVGYTITLPGDFRSTHEGDYDRWSEHGGGLVVELRAEPTTSCTGGITGARKTVDGVERDYAAGIDFCVGRDRYLACSVQHTRGYLEAGERDAAIGLCRTLRP